MGEGRGEVRGVDGELGVVDDVGTCGWRSESRGGV